jgi:thymidylate synthase (FAD)
MKAELLNYFGDDLMIINAARVSYGKSKETLDEKDEKLIKYLVEHKHTAPFRHPQLQFRIECPIFVERQLFKHQIGLCLAGDSEIYFLQSSGSIQKIKIKDLFYKWENGRPHQNTIKDKEYQKRRTRLKNIRVLNEETGFFEVAHIKDVFKSGIKEIFEIVLENGKKIKCSEYHKIFTKDGWKTINNGLSLADFVGTNGLKVAGNGNYRSFDYLNECRKNGWSVKQIADDCDVSYHTIRKWLKIHKLSFTKEEVCFKRGNKPWNDGVTGYSLNFTEEGYKNKLYHAKRMVKKGKDSHFWRGGITKERNLIGAWSTKNAHKVHQKYNFTCQQCSQSSGTLHAHHIIPVAQDPSKGMDFNNLITVCEECHKKIHFSLENEMNFASKVLSKDFIPFEYKKRIGRESNKNLKVNFSKIVSILKIGTEEVFDIEIDGKWKNFVANGIVVHNSANSISGRYVDFSDNYFEIQSLRRQSLSSKQGSEGILDRSDLIEKIKTHINNSASLYKELCDAGTAKEQARVILPLCLETQFIWTGSLLAFIHFWNLRLKKDTQEETRTLALEMLNLVKNINDKPFIHSLQAFGF